MTVTIYTAAPCLNKYYISLYDTDGKTGRQMIKMEYKIYQGEIVRKNPIGLQCNADIYIQQAK